MHRAVDDDDDHHHHHVTQSISPRKEVTEHASKQKHIPDYISCSTAWLQHIEKKDQNKVITLSPIWIKSLIKCL